MAYNIIKGKVEFSNSSTGSIESLVDIWRNQSVGGVKSFTSTVSASAFWDTVAGGEVRALKSLIGSDADDRVLTSNGNSTLTAEQGLTYNGSSLGLTGHLTASLGIKATEFSGSGNGITHILLNPDHLAATNYDGLANRLSASNIVLGLGISSSIDPAGLGHGSELQVTGGQGITVDTEGVRVLTASNGGLAFTGLTLQVDASKTSNKGGGPSNNDAFIIADSGDSSAIKNLTYSQIKTAITDSIASPAITSYTNNGDNRIITSVNSTTVNAEANFTFSGTDLLLSGNMSVSGANHVPALVVQPGGASSAKIGINVSEPGTTLQVTNNAGAATLGLHRTSSAFYVDGDDIGDLLWAGSAAGNPLTVAARVRAEADGTLWTPISTPTRITFHTTATGSASPSERMVINNSGNVGIGFNSPTSRLYVNGDISSSLGVHITGSDPHISIGARRGSSPNAIMLNVSPGQGAGEAMNNKILALFKRTEETDERTILAVTGSGKVAVGGAHLTGVFNVSGSDAETLVSVKSDSKNPALSLTGVGDLFVGRGAYLSGAVQHNYVVKTTSADTYLSGATDRVGIYNLSSPHNAYLPLLSDTLNGVTITVKCVGSADITVTGSGPSNQLIDQQANKVLSTGDSLTVIGYNGPTGYQWAILNYYNAS